MAKAFIHSPLSPLLFFAMLFMGLLGLVFTPRQEDPQISVPMVDIFIQYPGAAAQQVSRLAIEPLQRIMSEIPAVEHVYSAAEHGQGIVTIQFVVGEQLERSVFKVHDKLQSNMDKMPPGVLPPLVKPKGIDDVPVVALTLWSQEVDDGALRTLALDVMQNLKEIENTGQSFVIGGRPEQVLIEVKPERLAGFGISLAQVAQTIQSANSEIQAGTVETGNSHFSVYTGKFLSTAHDVEQLIIGTYQGTPIYVRDIADVTLGPEPQSERRQFVNYFSGPSYGHEEQKHNPQVTVPTAKVDGAPAVTIAVSKKIGTNGVTVANTILAQVEKLKGSVIPSNVHVEVTRNYGKTANDKVNDLIKKLFIATGAVTVLVLFSLGIRPAIVVTLVIPVVILITVFTAWILGYTIDRVSLFALIFSIGILVDDAIVVIENIYRRWLLKGETDTATAVDAVREVGNPTILATFTVVAALLPMGFVSGMMGPYMEPIPALGSVAMIFSLLAAFIFTPWLAMRIKPSLAALQKAEQKEHRFNQRLERFFRKILPPLFNSRLKGGLFVIILIISFGAALSMFYTQHVEVKMLPLDNKPEFNVFIKMPAGTALLETANLTYNLAEKIREIPEVTALQTYVGTSQPYDFNGMVRHYYMRQSPWLSDIHVQLKDKVDRHRSSHQIAIAARQQLQELLKNLKNPPKIAVVEMPPGPPVLQSVVAEIYGPDDTTRRQVAQQMTTFFEQAETIDDVDNYMVEEHEVWHFKVDSEKSVRQGISVDVINQNLAMALGGFKLGDVKQGTRLEPTYIVIQIPLAVRSQLSRLYDLSIPAANGSTVPLAELGRFEKVKQDQTYYQKDLRPVEYVVGDSVGVYDQANNEYHLGAPIYGMREVEEMLDKYKTPDGVNLRESGCHVYFSLIPLCDRYLGPPKTYGQSGLQWAGEWTVTYETFRDMGLAFGAAMILIYILVVWLFGNFIVPAIIMVPIPLTLLGIIPGHWYLGAAFTATSMIGWIALAGIIVRNSILLVDYSIHEIQKGSCIQDAVILACKTRTRPILITAFALVAGSGVILFDPIFQGMAISLLFGVLVSTLLTLVVIPLGCISIGPVALCASGLGDIPSPSLTTAGLDTKPLTPPPAVYKTPLWLRLWGGIIGLVLKIIGFILAIINIIKMIFYLIRGIFLLLFSMLQGWWEKIKIAAQPPKPPAPPSPPPAPPVVSPSAGTTTPGTPSATPSTAAPAAPSMETVVREPTAAPSMETVVREPTVATLEQPTVETPPSATTTPHYTATLAVTESNRSQETPVTQVTTTTLGPSESSRRPQETPVTQMTTTTLGPSESGRRPQETPVTQMTTATLASSDNLGLQEMPVTQTTTATPPSTAPSPLETRAETPVSPVTQTITATLAPSESIRPQEEMPVTQVTTVAMVPSESNPPQEMPVIQATTATPLSTAPEALTLTSPEVKDDSDKPQQTSSKTAKKKFPQRRGIRLKTDLPSDTTGREETFEPEEDKKGAS
jgi:multidrug efflux pump subunit AcrB